MSHSYSLAGGAGRAALLQTVAAPAGAHLFQSGAWSRPEGGAFTARRAQPKRRVEELAASPSARAAGRRRRGLRPRRKRARLQVPPGVREGDRHHAERLASSAKAIDVSPLDAGLLDATVRLVR